VKTRPFEKVAGEILQTVKDHADGLTTDYSIEIISGHITREVNRALRKAAKRVKKHCDYPATLDAVLSLLIRPQDGGKK
jgi:hypothetical protein